MMSLVVTILLLANHKDNEFIWNGRMMKVSKGSLITSIGHLAWQTGLTSRQIRTRLEELEKTGFLTCKTTNKYSVITVNKYEIYQTTGNGDKQNDKQTTSRRQADDNKQEGKEGEEGKEENNKDNVQGKPPAKAREEIPPCPPTLTPSKKQELDIIKSIFEYWKDKTKSTHSVFDGKRQGRIRARLREGYTAEQLKRCIDLAVVDPFHNGQNPRGKVYLGLQTIIRDAEKVDWWLQRKDPTAETLERARRFAAEAKRGIAEREARAKATEGK